MGVNWDSGLIYWKDHTPCVSERYSLTHLHPFIQDVELAATDKHAACNVRLHVSFGLHTFTRGVELNDEPHDQYKDNRELRTFCRARYVQSFQLPRIVRTLDRRKCEFARGRHEHVNYVTVEQSNGDRYAAFFDLRRFRRLGPNAIHLMVQSAYVLDARKLTPGKGRVHFRALLGHTLRGTAPRPPQS